MEQIGIMITVTSPATCCFHQIIGCHWFKKDAQQTDEWRKGWIYQLLVCR